MPEQPEQRPDPHPPGRRPRAPAVWKKLLLGLVVTLLGFGILELVLRLAGVQPALLVEDPFVGFASDVPHFIPDPHAPDNAVLVTAPNKLKWFNPQPFSRAKPAGTYRIFCMGGSTTYGRPYTDPTSFCGWLRIFLPEADPSRRWEVINAGGISYASYRVAALMKELCAYEPDCFIVYTGQNEFLEERSYHGILIRSQALLRAGALAARLRTYALMRQLRTRLARRRSEPAKTRYTLAGDVDPMLEHTVGPQSYSRDDRLRRQILEHYRFNLHRMVMLAQRAGARILFVTPASNLKDMSPFKSEHVAGLPRAQLEAWDEAYRLGLRRYREQDPARALEAWRAALQIDDRYAELHYRMGRALFDLRRFAEARQAFVRALNEDICPLRMPTDFRDALATVARERRVPLIEFDRMLDTLCRQARGHDSLGEEYFLDHVHPTIECHEQLALRLIEALAREGVVKPAAAWSPAAAERVAQHVLDGIDDRAHGAALATLGKVMNWAGKFEEAERLLNRSLAKTGENPGAYYTLGNSFASRGLNDEAMACYRKAIALDPDHAFTHNNLANVLLRKGQVDEAIAHLEQAARLRPDDIDPLNSLGNAYARKGRMQEAEACYERALKLDPRNSGVHYNYANALADAGRFDEALARYRAALKLEPRYTKARYNLGNTLAQMGRFKDAAREYRQILRYEPDNASAHNNLGNALAQLGSYRDAIRHYETVLRLEPDNASARRNIDAVRRAQREKRGNTQG
ncbi:MAG: tetratricopeptide repeat protein [Kiritimatiellae bacterium]|nr:tetratricopeptide repeat protein [Kiritimatiellia bacterium]